MKGKVRLLIFWVGKDGVGGGSVSLANAAEVDGQPWAEEIEVLFGSNPDNVPGGINRWGSGRERSYWTSNPSEGGRLLHSQFEGFMKHSKEERLSEVRSNAESEKAGGSFLYDGNRSTVWLGRSTSELRVFSTNQDFDYRNAKPVFCSYEKRVTGSPPEETKELVNLGKTAYQTPVGFLSALNQAVYGILTDAQDGEIAVRRSPVAYVYNANTYRLTVKKSKIEKHFDLPLEKGKPQRFERVVKAEFAVRKNGKSDDHEFTLWFPIEGPYRGIPLRITDKPRWWLHIELNLVPSPSGDTSLPTRANTVCE
jgi:hypothetical protein